MSNTTFQPMYERLTKEVLFHLIPAVSDAAIVGSVSGEQAIRFAKLAAERIKSSEEQLAAALVTIDALSLQVRLYTNGNHPNQPLVDDVERFRVEATRAQEDTRKLVRTVTRKAQYIHQLEVDNEDMRRSFNFLIEQLRKVMSSIPELPTTQLRKFGDTWQDAD